MDIGEAAFTASKSDVAGDLEVPLETGNDQVHLSSVRYSYMNWLMSRLIVRTRATRTGDGGGPALGSLGSEICLSRG